MLPLALFMEIIPLPFLKIKMFARKITMPSPKDFMNTVLNAFVALILRLMSLAFALCLFMVPMKKPRANMPISFLNLPGILFEEKLLLFMVMESNFVTSLMSVILFKELPLLLNVQKNSEQKFLILEQDILVVSMKLYKLLHLLLIKKSPPNISKIL